MKFYTSINKQSGAVLVVSLIVLLVLTILAVSASRTTLLQEKMTFAVRDGHLALESATLGIIAAEDFIESQTNLTNFNSSGNGGLYTRGNAPTDFFDSATWAANVRSDGTVPSGGSAASYFIEEVGEIGGEEPTSINVGSYGQSTGQGTVTGFRVISRGVGKSGTTERVISSYYGKRI